MFGDYSLVDYSSGIKQSDAMARQKNHLILSTRPLADAMRDVASLQRRQVAAMAMPVMSLVPLARYDLPDPVTISALIFTSRNAVSCFAASPPLGAWLDKPVFVVGAATGSAARLAGFKDVIVGRGGGAGLVPDILAAKMNGDMAILWPSAMHKSFDMQSALGAHDITVIDMPVYDMAPVSAVDPAVTRHLDDGGMLSVIIMSARSAILFVELLKTGNLWQHRHRISVIAGSAVIADSAGVGWKHIWVSKRPSRSRILAIATLVDRQANQRQVAIGKDSAE
ncbi:MAG: uroporphyrinogen-III synthase [Candidatus Puniceispirillum sp.]|jgi:uroporphyrinogen-III synthase|uniref:uroporphyrinogen-III synthase n=1 Tax=Candidatus Puniceispirillum sp. TaxID=2026719 RepID=UPI001EC3FCEC|nr:uroporphyrinogen-III synthase [Candidatus Puniceispirillum sp.]MBT6415493.1 uroporphyrinogen-III synthase [Candidatus Puniceispirillum sp.]MBT6566014.1 uroporphyrinogen-III synthase [Candidatus Puniceispirillum sp.]